MVSNMINPDNDPIGACSRAPGSTTGIWWGVLVAHLLSFLCCIIFFCTSCVSCTVYPMFTVSLDCQFLLTPSVFSNVYLFDYCKADNIIIWSKIALISRHYIENRSLCVVQQSPTRPIYQVIEETCGKWIFKYQSGTNSDNYNCVLICL